MRYCFIACDHGLGHIRRVVAVCRELELLTDASATILARQEHAKKFGREVDHFETRTTRSALMRGVRQACRWHERLPSLDAYDVIVSDNLPEVLELRADAILMGSFLWHQALEGIDTDYYRTAERLLRKYKPVMIGSGLFATRQLRSTTQFVDVGLFEQAPIAPGAATDLLVSCGYTDECLEQTRAAVHALAEREAPPYRKVHVEPRALPGKYPEWMQPADFSPHMYSGLAAAVVRPGAGAVTDALQAGARIFCFYENGNDELKYNAQQLERHGYGVDCGKAETAVDKALHRNTSSNGGKMAGTDMEFAGAKRAAAYIRSLSDRTG